MGDRLHPGLHTRSRGSDARDGREHPWAIPTVADLRECRRMRSGCDCPSRRSKPAKLAGGGPVSSALFPVIRENRSFRTRQFQCKTPYAHNLHCNRARYGIGILRAVEPSHMKPARVKDPNKSVAESRIQAGEITIQVVRKALSSRSTQHRICGRSWLTLLRRARTQRVVIHVFKVT